MPVRPTRKAALEAKRKIKENAPGESEQAVLIAPKAPAQRGRPAPSKPEEPEVPATRRTRLAAAQAARTPAAQAAPPAQAQGRAEPGVKAEVSAAALEEEELLPDPEEDMRGKEEGDEKAGPSGKKDAAEDEASTAPLPEKVPAISQFLRVICPLKSLESLLFGPFSPLWRGWQYKSDRLAQGNT